MSILLYFLFNGVVKKLLLLKIPKPIVLIFVLIFIFILFYFLGVLIYSSASSFIDRLQTPETQVPVSLSKGSRFTVTR